jgi:hypothetical protein
VAHVCNSGYAGQRSGGLQLEANFGQLACETVQKKPFTEKGCRSAQVIGPSTAEKKKKVTVFKIIEKYSFNTSRR